uniref:Uncharacterized protein n=1 Tax=Timema shepardi TaxID=629360 RepID=A0A7R9FXY3_TIMSH|nr:unnamed protein product [Timema shepardi]
MCRARVRWSLFALEDQAPQNLRLRLESRDYSLNSLCRTVDIVTDDSTGYPRDKTFSDIFSEEEDEIILRWLSCEAEGKDKRPNSNCSRRLQQVGFPRRVCDRTGFHSLLCGHWPVPSRRPECASSVSRLRLRLHFADAPPSKHVLVELYIVLCLSGLVFKIVQNVSIEEDESLIEEVAKPPSTFDISLPLYRDRDQRIKDNTWKDVSGIVGRSVFYPGSPTPGHYNLEWAVRQGTVSTRDDRTVSVTRRGHNHLSARSQVCSQVEPSPLPGALFFHSLRNSCVSTLLDVPVTWCLLCACAHRSGLGKKAGLPGRESTVALAVLALA